MSDLFDFKPKATAFAVMGNPVAHSKSPQIHAAFASQFDLNIEYTRIQVDPGGLEQAVSHFFAHGGGGLNITLPYKVEAWQLCRGGGNLLSPRAESAQAVNTLAMDGSRLSGDNTDGAGLVNDLTVNCNVPLESARVLVIGAGGAVRGVLAPLLEQQPAQLDICNRTRSKAEELATAFGGRVSALTLDNTPSQPYDLIINGTASSLDGQLPGIHQSCIGTQTVAYDMVYANEPTVFMSWALDEGAAATHDGLGMLVEQAAESFEIWHGRRPHTTPVIAMLRQR